MGLETVLNYRVKLNSRCFNIHRSKGQLTSEFDFIDLVRKHAKLGKAATTLIFGLVVYANTRALYF